VRIVGLRAIVLSGKAKYVKAIMNKKKTLAIWALLAFFTLCPGIVSAIERTPDVTQSGPAFRNSNIPKVLIIGDSISLGYTPSVVKMLEGEAEVKHSKGDREVGSNAGATDRGIEYLDMFLGHEKWDVIHFNWGLWDLCYRHPDAKPYGHRDKINGTISIPLDQYEKNLEQLVARLKKTGAQLIWAATTKVPEGEAGRFVGDEIKYNSIAARIMKKHGIPTNDIHALTRSFDADMFKLPGDVHFKPEGSKMIAEQVAASIRIAIKTQARVIHGFEWKSEVPRDCPFEQSETFTGIFFTGRHSDYQCGDTFYPSWASDGNMYSPWTDGWTDGQYCTSGGSLARGFRTGHAVMTGDDPLELAIKNTSPPKRGWAKPYRGRYPCGSLVHNGIWYYGTYCLGPSATYMDTGFSWGFPNLGPMPGFQMSRDLGKTWNDSPHSPETPLFPEPAKFLEPVKMGAPHFIDFGKNMEHSPDGKAYLIAMGAEIGDPKPRPCLTVGEQGTVYKINEMCTNRVHLGLRSGEAASESKETYRTAFEQVKGKRFAHANLSWITADQIYVARVTPSPETINDLNAYEFFAGHDKQGTPVWTNDFAKIKPLIEWNNNMGCVTATYVAALKKYLMCITDGWPTVAEMDSYILEADKITGPWRMVTYMKDFGQQAYFLNFPSKFISDDGKTLWLCYSANYSDGWNGVQLDFNPPGGRYGLSLHEVRLQSPRDARAMTNK